MEEHEGADGADGTAAVLYGIFTSFTESLAGLDQRLAAIEAAVRDGQAAVVGRLDAVESALRADTEEAGASPTGSDEGLGALGSLVDRRADALEERINSLEATLAAVRSLVQDQADETSRSLGRRATEAGRRLASDLGLRSRGGRTDGGG